MTEVLIYLIYIFITTFLSYFIRKKNSWKINLFLCILIALIWSSYTITLPYNYSGDRINYVTWFTRVYSKINISKEFIMNSNIEIGWILFNIVLSKLTTNVYTVLYVYMFLPMLTILIWLMYQKNSMYKYNILLGCTLIPFYCTYLCRQMTAMVFFIVGISFLMNNKRWIYIICVGLASLFHQSAIYVGILLFFVSMINKDKSIYKYMFFSILLLPFIPTLFDLLNYIFDISKWSIGNVNISASVLKAVPYFILLLICITFRKRDKEYCSNLNLFALFFIAFFWVLSGYQYWAYRLSIYLIPIYIIVIASLFEMRMNRNNHSILILITAFNFCLTIREIYLVSTYF